VILASACKKESTSPNKYSTEDTTPTDTWMHDLITQYPDKGITLLDIVLPGAHDAGMYELNNCTFGANACNTQTQILNFHDQLLQGVRVFDVRPSKSNDKIYTEHSTGCNGFGCKGALLDEIYNDINSFLNTHAEFVILEISHYCGTSPSDTALLNMTNRIFGDKIYKETTPLALPLIKTPLKDIIGNSGKGKVLFIYEGVADNSINRTEGLFSSSVKPTEGSWTNSHSLATMLQGQINEYANFSNDGNHLFQFSWQITQDETQAISCAINPNAAPIQRTADSANTALSSTINTLIANQQIRKGRIPNIIYFDYSNNTISRECIRISKLNLE
jgi:hypothetical protein